MSQRLVYQLGPTSAFTEQQRRELNALWLRLTQELATMGGTTLTGAPAEATAGNPPMRTVITGQSPSRNVQVQLFTDGQWRTISEITY